MMDKLKPCPFCGNDRVLLRNVEYDKTLWLVQCNQCHSEFTVSRWVNGQKSSNHDRLIKAWNRRDYSAKDNVNGKVNGDLISRKWVLKEIRAHKAHAQSFRQVTYATGYMCGLSVIEGRLADAPIVDAVPVVHAQLVYYDGYAIPKCSACGFSIADVEWGFCPHCGAKFDE